MPPYDLKTDSGLLEACNTHESTETWTEGRREWITHLAETFEWVRSAGEEERTSLEFQHRLWEDNWVAAVGQGNIRLDAVLEDVDFRRWLARRSVVPLQGSQAERIATLSEFYQELVERLGQSCDRIPHLKIFRVLAALYPGAVTTIADRNALRRLYSAMGGARGADPVQRHVWVLERLERVLGPPESDEASIARRVALPWILYACCVQEPEPIRTVKPGDTSGKELLVPLPAARRRRGLTSIRGGFSSLLSALEFVREGVSRDELLDFLRSESPDVKESTLGTIVNILQSEFAVIRREGDQYILTERGESVLESQEPSDLSDWLLTHILGVDHVICGLHEQGPRPSSEITKTVQQVNPGWTTGYAPHVILVWLRSLGVIESRTDGNTALTKIGEEWAARIHWKPESLPREPDIEPPESEDEPLPRPQIPEFSVICKSISRAGHFGETLVAGLHAGIWAHRRRHFAVLTGLSGSGKTLLAREYAKALVPEAAPSSRHLCTIAVQPGWYDPGALLGYVNPLRGESYVSTPFLEFLLRAGGDPKNPYIAVLDEMNLSHPEQYMAPLLSAMETGGRIDFHTEGDHFDGIPSSIPYPSNLVLIGTVNMDETTHGLSDKVLDRAFTLEFWNIDLNGYPGWGTRSLSADDEDRARAVLGDLIAALSPARLHFGWRIVGDVLDFIAMAKSTNAPLPLANSLDSVIYAKVLPKLRGDDAPRIREALEGCAAVLRKHALPNSLAKLEELRADLEATGSARFWR